MLDLGFAQLWLRRFGRRGPSAVGQLAMALLVVGACHLGLRFLGDAVADAVVWVLSDTEPSDVPVY